ncbi:hypothetical protein A7P25_22070 [Achromobacter xylosoxidans]|nr:hypothetical protein A7P25_22070 [Achromobacter xylosoxidans]
MGNKFSLMGIYYDYIALDFLPTYLARFCAHAAAITPVDRPFQKLTIQLLLNHTVVQELQLPPDQLAMRADRTELSTPSRLQGFGGNLVVSPLYIAGPGEITVQAITEEGILKGPRLAVVDGAADRSRQ